MIKKSKIISFNIALEFLKAISSKWQTKRNSQGMIKYKYLLYSEQQNCCNAQFKLKQLLSKFVWYVKIFLVFSDTSVRLKVMYEHAQAQTHIQRILKQTNMRIKSTHYQFRIDSVRMIAMTTAIAAQRRLVFSVMVTGINDITIHRQFRIDELESWMELMILILKIYFVRVYNTLIYFCAFMWWQMEGVQASWKYTPANLHTSFMQVKWKEIETMMKIAIRATLVYIRL